MPSRQYEWQLEQDALGNCRNCGKPRKHYAMFCDACTLKRRVALHKKYDIQPWRPGSPGRKPYVRTKTR